MGRTPKQRNIQDKESKKVTASAEFTYKVLEDRIIVYSIKNGDNYTSKMMNLDVELSAYLVTHYTKKSISLLLCVSLSDC